MALRSVLPKLYTINYAILYLASKFSRYSGKHLLLLSKFANILEEVANGVPTNTNRPAQDLNDLWHFGEHVDFSQNSKLTVK